jgi:TrmH family RNA methyltransferase
VITISSRQNPFVQHCRSLARRRDAAGGDILLDGLHLLSDALAAGVTIAAAAAPDAFWQSPAGVPIARALETGGAQIYAASPAVIEAASPVRTPSGIVAVARWQPAGPGRVLEAQPALVVCAVEVQDPGNVGAIIRSADAAGATGVVVSAGSADPYGWKALRGSMGSAFRLPVAAGARIEEVVGEARRRGVRILSTTPSSGVSLYDADLRGPVMILVGGEGAGLPPLLQDAAYAAPQTLGLLRRHPVRGC